MIPHKATDVWWGEQGTSSHYEEGFPSFLITVNLSLFFNSLVVSCCCEPCRVQINKQRNHKLLCVFGPPVEHQSVSQRAVLRGGADYEECRGIFVGALLFVFGASACTGFPLKSTVTATRLLGLLLSLRDLAHRHTAVCVSIRLDLADLCLVLFSCFWFGVRWFCRKLLRFLQLRCDQCLWMDYGRVNLWNKVDLGCTVADDHICETVVIRLLLRKADKYLQKRSSSVKMASFLSTNLSVISAQDNNIQSPLRLNTD